MLNDKIVDQLLNFYVDNRTEQFKLQYKISLLTVVLFYVQDKRTSKNIF